jgi:hypothetical protein
VVFFWGGVGGGGAATVAEDAQYKFLIVLGQNPREVGLTSSIKLIPVKNSLKIKTDLEGTELAVHGEVGEVHGTCGLGVRNKLLTVLV